MDMDKKIVKELHKLTTDFELIELFECIADNGETENFLDAVDRYMQALCDAEYLEQLQTRCKFTQDEIEDLYLYLKVIYRKYNEKSKMYRLECFYYTSDTDKTRFIHKTYSTLHGAKCVGTRQCRQVAKRNNCVTEYSIFEIDTNRRIHKTTLYKTIEQFEHAVKNGQLS